MSDIQKIPPAFFQGRPVLGFTASHSVGGGTATISLPTGSPSFSSPRWDTPPEGRELSLTWGGREVYKGYVGSIQRTAMHGTSKLEVTMKPLINKLSEEGGVATTTIRGPAALQSKPATSEKNLSPSVLLDVGNYMEGDNFAEWILRVANYISNSDVSTILIPGKAYPKYKIKETLIDTVFHQCCNRDSIQDTPLSYIQSLIGSVALNFVSRPSFQGKFLLHPVLPMMKTPFLTIGPSDYISVTDNTAGSIFPTINICVSRYTGSNEKDMRHQDSNALLSFKDIVDMNVLFHTYPDTGDGIYWYAERSPMFGSMTSLKKVDTDALGDASAQLTWGAMAYQGRSINIAIPWSRYFSLAENVGNIIAVNLPSGFGESKVYGLLNSANITVRREPGEGNSTAQAVIGITHVRGEAENGHAFDEHPLFSSNEE